MIRHKGIWHERLSDAPFVGGLISAIACDMNCWGCFNTHLKQAEILKNTASEIIAAVLSNPFNEGIILGGLEWTLQAGEAKKLMVCALENGLKVMLYTGLTEAVFKEQFSELYELPVYIKFGQYMAGQKCDNHYSCGVKLSSKNQYIREIPANAEYIK